MDKKVLYSRDMLYPTENLYEPGSVHVDVLSPDKSARLSVIVESKTEHSLVKNIDSIVRIMQNDIFDRILVNIKSNVSLYLKTNEELKKDYGGKEYLKVIFNGETIDFEPVEEFEI